MQGVLHWVGQPKAGQEPARFEARLYVRLFSTQTPGSKKKKVEDGQDPATATGQAAPTLWSCMHPTATCSSKYVTTNINISLILWLWSISCE